MDVPGRGLSPRAAKKPIASLENRRQGSYSRPPLDVLGEPQGSSPPHREEGPAGAGRLNGLWWS